MGRFHWISFTSDYGLSDGFAAACHGVLARLAPAVRVLDVTHQIAPGDVSRGSAVLAQTVEHLPPAVHLAVVDPGVGTTRRAIAIEAVDGILVGPDNGLLIPAAEALGGILRVVELTAASWFAPAISATFHGRDVFAPSAARLALGADLTTGGVAIGPASLARLPEPVVVITPGWVDAQVRSIDRFGNVQLAARSEVLDTLGPRLRVGSMPAIRARTFGEAPLGSLVVFVDAAGYVAVGINGGRAVVALSVMPGDLVRVATA
ncbi:MAG: SAM-dependent chlorinase/fluorinase [Dactylosporangium sp.]|nr:SAM-dependent chlorinase/fluorinase [Dactylosporangium sp.]NNJ59408.1 SAM-dependent chlorinase/fluorinase [Dactylosporangium sp.]